MQIRVGGVVGVPPTHPSQTETNMNPEPTTTPLQRCQLISGGLPEHWHQAIHTEADRIRQHLTDLGIRPGKPSDQRAVTATLDTILTFIAKADFPRPVMETDSLYNLLAAISAATLEAVNQPTGIEAQ